MYWLNIWLFFSQQKVSLLHDGFTGLHAKVPPISPSWCSSAPNILLSKSYPLPSGFPFEAMSDPLLQPPSHPSLDLYSLHDLRYRTHSFGLFFSCSLCASPILGRLESLQCQDHFLLSCISHAICLGWSPQGVFPKYINLTLQRSWEVLK